MTDHARCEERIRDLETQVTASAARAIAREQEHAVDLRAARGALARLREAILAGHLDAAQARAASIALSILDGEPMIPDAYRALAAAFIAVAEAHKVEQDRNGRARDVLSGVDR